MAAATGTSLVAVCLVQYVPANRASHERRVCKGGTREGIVIHRRIRDRKIVEYWAVSDVARVLQQIGVLPTPAR